MAAGFEERRRKKRKKEGYRKWRTGGGRVGEGLRRRRSNGEMEGEKDGGLMRNKDLTSFARKMKCFQSRL